MELQTVVDQLVVFGAQYGLKVIGAILILIVGRIAAGVGRGVVRRALERAKTEPLIVSFAASMTYILILVVAVLAALAAFGVQTTSFIAILGAAGFAIGFALQGSLANFAAGVLILVLRPYKVGDVIEAAGVLGTVKAIHLFTTEVSTPDNIKVMVPNGAIYGNVIKNITGYETRRVDLVIGIGYSSSIPRAIEIVQHLIAADERILEEPEPQIAVSELADSSVNFVVRPWVKKEDYWTVKFDLTRQIKEAFDANGIEIPFPQRTVHLMSANAA